MDQRAILLVQWAMQLILSGNARYRDAEVGDVVDELLNTMEAAVAVLDHPSTCEGCPSCQNQDVRPKGETIQ